MNVLDIFSGIGGFSLGLERAGMRTVAFCEIEPYARAVLARHWPNVPCYDDVRTLTADRLRADGIIPDVICGGFPCQDISKAGAGAGIDGARSGLWSEYSRIIGEVRPQFVIVENVSALLGRGINRVLGDLAALGYDAEWHCIRASDVGAPHLRDRVWIIANPNGVLHAGKLDTGTTRRQATRSKGRDNGQGKASHRERLRSQSGPSDSAMADAIGAGLEGRPIFAGYLADKLAAIERSRSLLHADSAGSHAGAQTGIHRGQESGRPWHGKSERSDWWDVEPDVGRVAYGVSDRVDRLKGLGNAVIPQIPQIIGEAIMSIHQTPRRHYYNRKV